MKIESIDVLVAKVELKKNAKSEAYLLIDFLDIESGDSFNVMSKEIELMQKLQPMTKYTISLSLTNSKFGLRLGIEEVEEVLGGI